MIGKTELTKLFQPVKHTNIWQVERFHFATFTPVNRYTTPSLATCSCPAMPLQRPAFNLYFYDSDTV